MKWIKKGCIYAPSNTEYTHASIPVVDFLANGNIRIYYSSRDKQGRSRIFSLETIPDAPEKIISISEEEILPLGDLGTFDDNGMMPSCLVDYKGKKYLYYIGWNPQVTVTYRLSIGLAISDDGGLTFKRFSKGPILDRGVDEPFFNTAPCIHYENKKWRMWFVSCTNWKIINGKPEPQYFIRYAESSNGIHWKKNIEPCIDYIDENEAIARPWVFKYDKIFYMLYSHRNMQDYRTNKKMSYRIGLASSIDGLLWERHDNYSGIEPSESGWDSEMVCYPAIYKFNNKVYMLYNGNGFGKTGFGYAVLRED
jgi:hypothetical protein